MAHEIKKTETRGLEMAFLIKISQTIISAFLDCFKANEMRFEQVFDNLTFKHMDALRGL